MNRKLVAVAAATAVIAFLLVVSLGERGSGSTLGSRPSSDNAGSAESRPFDFWQLIESTRQAAGNDTGRQSELLEERLSQLPAQSSADFQRTRHRLDEQIYTWDVWAAAYVVEDGCSDDCFRDFRAYLISLGQGPYETALRDPDSLAPVIQDAEEGDWENAGSDGGDSDLSGRPRGKPWDSENEDGLAQRYPRLAARFR